MSALLLDTHVVLWLLDDSERLGADARSRIEGARRVHFSAASAWEIAIKRSLGRLAIPDDFADAVVAAGLHDLPITRAHALAADHTALPHRDPFDTLLVAQARAEQLTLLTADAKILDAWEHALDARR
ncbi:type II toxin-antitoxin system VapC family toxin [Nocardioides sp. BYT-33-1]|uniref:type II toxin-antitoxin system VapC family toxin n=1 Tax=Nocardioides sp. BYT-33-1 TaxID=3416952 RepID=UPI003F529C97